MESSEFSPQDSEAIFGLAERLTGNSVRGNLMLANVGRRMDVTGCSTLFEYLRYVETKPEELPYLISSLLVHTTSFFREEPHFKRFREFLESNLERFKKRPIRVLSAACSTGEEVYSFGLVLEWFRKNHPGFDYQIEGRDIDVLCLNKGQKAVYSKQELKRIPPEYSAFVLEGSGKTEELFTVTEDLRKRAKFTSWNLVKLGSELDREVKFDFVICRNVLIYFTPAVIEKVVAGLVRLLHPEGFLCLGHSETVDGRKFALESTGNSIYRISSEVAANAAIATKGRKNVLVIDDSASVRKIMKALLEGSDLHPILAGSAEEATELLKMNRVDLITLDLHLPGKDGLSWLTERRREGLRVPCVIISDDYPSEAYSTFGALENGAQDYFHKGQILTCREDLLARFAGLMEGASQARLSGGSKQVAGQKQRLRRPELILIGASIGGPDALTRLLKDMPVDAPPVVVVQHISENFARAFSDHLCRASGLRRPNPVNGMVLERGCLYMADGDFHIGVKRKGEQFNLIVSREAHVKRHRPSIDFLFKSLGERSGCERIFAAILTGMGADGAEGILELKNAGAMTFAQEADSCVVFGMAKEAVKLGAIKYIGTIPEIRGQMDLAIAIRESEPPEQNSKETKS